MFQVQIPDLWDIDYSTIVAETVEASAAAQVSTVIMSMSQEGCLTLFSYFCTSPNGLKNVQNRYLWRSSDL